MSNLFVIDETRPNVEEEEYHTFPIILNVQFFDFNNNDFLTMIGTLTIVQAHHDYILMQIIHTLELVLNIYDLLDALQDIHSVLETISEILVELRIRPGLLDILDVLRGFSAVLLITLEMPGEIKIQLRVPVAVFLQLDFNRALDRGSLESAT